MSAKRKSVPRIASRTDHTREIAALKAQTTEIARGDVGRRKGK